MRILLLSLSTVGTAGVTIHQRTLADLSVLALISSMTTKSLSNSYDQANPGTYMVGFEATVTANQTATFTTTLSPKFTGSTPCFVGRLHGSAGCEIHHFASVSQHDAVTFDFN